MIGISRQKYSTANPRSHDDIELALAATEDSDAFILSPGSAAYVSTPGLERERLRSGATSAGFEGSKPWGTSSHNTRFDQLRSHAQVGGCVFITTLVMVAAIAVASHVFSREDKGSNSGGHAENYAHFYVIGDWGRQGLRNQSEVAAVMGQLAHTRAPEFVISTGDNFYQYGLSSVADDGFRESFIDVYSASSLRSVPWHAVLGNHDYGPTASDRPATCPTGVECFWSPLHELDVGLVARDSRWHCERSFEMRLAGGVVEIFFIDTNPFIVGYQNQSWANHLGGLAQQSWRAELMELEGKLARSTAAWKLVIGHHPIFSSGQHGSTTDLVHTLDPVLRKYGVQAYMCGHDHHLEYLKAPLDNLHYIVSGAGSEARPLAAPRPNQVWAYYGSGFVAATLKAEELHLKYYGIVDGTSKPVYDQVIPRV